LSILEVSGEKARKIASLLSSEACFHILEQLNEEELDISTLAKKLNFSEAHISEEVGRLEDAGFVKVHYMRGKRGIRKVCALNYVKIIIKLRKGSENG